MEEMVSSLDFGMLTIKEKIHHYTDHVFFGGVHFLSRYKINILNFLIVCV